MSVTPHEDFTARLAASVADGTFARLTLGKPRGDDPTLQKVIIRPVTLKAGPHLSFVWRHDTRDITKNLIPTDAVHEISGMLGTTFHSAHLATTQQSVQLEYNKKGEPRLHLGRTVTPFINTAHDHVKSRLLPPESQEWLQALGVTNAAGVVREGMADKRRQIHNYVEILSHLIEDSPLALGAPNGPAHDRPVEITDMGCGKGYSPSPRTTILTASCNVPPAFAASSRAPSSSPSATRSPTTPAGQNSPSSAAPSRTWNSRRPTC